MYWEGYSSSCDLPHSKRRFMKRAYILSAVRISIPLFVIWLINSLEPALAGGPSHVKHSFSKPVATLGDMRLSRVNYKEITPHHREPYLPNLERINLSFRSGSRVLASVPQFSSKFAGKFAAISQNRDFVFFTLDPEAQRLVTSIVSTTAAPHVAVVVLNPSDGKIIAMAEKSPTLPHAALHADYPAASLFKVITGAAAIEHMGVSSRSIIKFRGGNYTLGLGNFSPDTRRDNRVMFVGEAMGKSCNPVFGRLALQLPSHQALYKKGLNFGFNNPLFFQLPLDESSAFIPANLYQLSRTGAGFGDVSLSPVHAAAIMGSLASDGLLKSPQIIEKIISPNGDIVFRGAPRVLGKVVGESTRRELLNMMVHTTSSGTSSRSFKSLKKLKNSPYLIPGKTGTLSGNNPKGLTTWFIGTNVPNGRSRGELAVAVVTVGAKNSTARASGVAARVMAGML
jgi:cell division protein FtsI/penicillin-binding protein 2